MSKPWFQSWFGKAYQRLYHHRDVLQAETQARALLRILPVTSGWRWLDVGCGSGRHLETLSRMGHFHSVGVDLSGPLVREARALGLAVARGDMRHLPFRPASFDAVSCFFTSFGYFATFEEDVEALSQFVTVLKPGGYLFLDLNNREHVVRNLVPEDCRMVGGAETVQRRRLEGAVVIKEIEIRQADGRKECYQERVRLFGLEEMLALAGRFSLRHLGTFGDEAGGPYVPSASPRMSLLLQRDSV